MRKDQKVLILWAILTAICALTSAQDLDNKSNHNRPDLDTIIKKVRSMRLKLRKETIASVATPNDPNSKTAVLEEYIKQLDALHIPKTITEKADKTVPTKQPKQTKKDEPTPIIPLAKTIKETVKSKKEIFNNKVDALLEKPDNIIDPLAVADAIYKDEDYENALKFYNLALKRMSTQKDPSNRPWAIFQSANCLRLSDSAEAAKLYQQLIAEFPNSHWTPAAMLQNTIITWTAANNPLKITEKFVSDPNSL